MTCFGFFQKILAIISKLFVNGQIFLYFSLLNLFLNVDLLIMALRGGLVMKG